MGNIKDLTNKTFGQLTVIKFDKIKNGKAYWICKCTCGNIKSIRGSSLTSGKYTACGCNQYSKKDLVGLKFGYLTVIKKHGHNKNKEVLWECKCKCGKITYVDTHSLESGNTRSCGCLLKKVRSKNARKDITGMTFGKLTAIKDVGKNKYNNVLWLCQCECGNTIIKTTNNLISGKTKSCGCLKKEYNIINRSEELIGKEFDYLGVIKYYGKNQFGELMWLCKCLRCCNFKIVSTSYLKSKKTKSCGCYGYEMISKKNTKLYLEGMRFGRLIVIKRAPKRKKQQYWLCQCDCGNLTTVKSGALTSGKTLSCGCYGIEKSKARKGELSPTWKGGTSFEPYCPKFNNAKKEEIRNKFGRKCLICGKTEEDNGKKLSVHHVNYDKMQGCDGKPWELVPLCTSCHNKTNGKFQEEYWMQRIRSILSWRVIQT